MDKTQSGNSPKRGKGLDIANNSSIEQKNETNTGTIQSSATSQPPPPPPPPLPQIADPKASNSKSNSTVSMKMLNWKAIMPKELSSSCVWSKCQEDEQPLEKVFVELGKRFCSKPAKKINYGVKSSVALQVIDGRTAHALLILLRGQFKTSSHQVKQYILRCDSSILDVDIIERLIKCMPKPHQIEQFEKLKKDGTKFVEAEEFLVNLCEIRRIVPRLNCLKFKICYHEISQNLQTSINIGIAACKELIDSKKLAKILGLILSIGNFMNFNKEKGRAIAFELPVLRNLIDIKDIDSKKTLMNFLVDTIELEFPEILNFGDDLIHLNEAVRINVEYIRDTIQELNESKEILKKELEHAKVPPILADDKFTEVMSPFFRQCCNQLEVLTKMMLDMHDSYIKVAEYFAFDGSKYSMEECFSDIKIFKDLFVQEFTNMTKSREPPSVHVRKQQTKGAEIQQSVVCRNFSVKLKRLTKEEIATALATGSCRKRKRSE